MLPSPPCQGLPHPRKSRLPEHHDVLLMRPVKRKKKSKSSAKAHWLFMHHPSVWKYPRRGYCHTLAMRQAQHCTILKTLSIAMTEPADNQAAGPTYAEVQVNSRPCPSP